jgi:hypothetical protein
MTLVSLAWAAALWLAPAAAGTDNPLGFESPEAHAQFDAAMEAWQADDLAVAQRLLESAYALEPKPALLYSLGQIARLRGDCAEARRRLQAFLDSGPSPKAAAEARVNLERCADDPIVTPPAPAVEPAPEPAPPPPADPPPPRGPDALGITLTTVGSVTAAVGVGLFGTAFAVQQRAERAHGVDRFERGIDQARAQYWTGVGLMAAGSAVLVGGVVRLVLAKQRRGTARLARRR